MMKVVLVLLMLPSIAAAQYDSVKRRIAPLRAADAILYTYTSPIRWKGSDWLEFGAVAAGTAALTLTDKPIRDFWLRQNGKALDVVNHVGHHYGKPYSGFILAGGIYATGLLIKNEWARETALALSTTLVTTGLLEMALKPLVGRARPGKGDGNYDVDFWNEEGEFHSFPSGHASIAFSTSFVMAKRTKNVPMKIFFYSLAGATVVCRFYSDAHWNSDIAFGSVLAWYCSEAVLKRLNSNKLRNPRKKTNWNVTPYAGGLTLRGTFN